LSRERSRATRFSSAFFIFNPFSDFIFDDINPPYRGLQLTSVAWLGSAFHQISAIKISALPRLTMKLFARPRASMTAPALILPA
jgi:hypothetical protein